MRNFKPPLRPAIYNRPSWQIAERTTAVFTAVNWAYNKVYIPYIRVNIPAKFCIIIITLSDPVCLLISLTIIELFSLRQQFFLSLPVYQNNINKMYHVIGWSRAARTTWSRFVDRP